MKKVKPLLYLMILLVAICTIISVTLGCNGGCDFRGYDCMDTKYHFDRAIISMPDGTTKEIDLVYWADADGEQLTLTASDGTRYLVSSINCILIEDN